MSPIPTAGPPAAERRAAPGQAAAARPIRLLPDAVVDQIAAGEVVERPASVVKELVENALDAGAGRVRVEIRDGGCALVAVADDGHGMSAPQARLALQRHATSKLAHTDDLERIRSFGFRGEALPSIASVSRLRLRTRAAAGAGGSDDGLGHEILVEGGRVLSERPVGTPVGTRVEVADLFAAVPARRKFLKRPQTEWGHIVDWLGRLALALPGIHLDVQRDDRPALVWPATTDPLERIASVLSERDAAALVAAEHATPDGRLRAFVSAPEHTRPTTAGLYLFVNGRPVRDRLMRQALLDVYRDWLPRGRFPTAVLMLEVDPAAVDVNVHPAKWEVRFADPRAIHRLIRHTVRRAIESRRWLGAAPAAAPGPDAGRWQTLPAPSAPEREAQASLGGAAGPLAARGAALGPATLPAEHVAEGPPAPVPRESGAPRPFFGTLRSLGQLHASYLLVEGEQGLLLVDQHAAHERILYERLRAQWLASGVASQGLLLPQPVALDGGALAALREGAEAAARLGFEIDAFGEQTALVRAVPALLADRDPVESVRELAQALRGAGPDAAPRTDDAAVTRWLPVADRLFATLACHAARRFGDHLEPEEQQALLRELDTIPWAPTCPHGRPVAVAFDRSEIERRFARR